MKKPSNLYPKNLAPDSINGRIRALAGRPEGVNANEVCALLGVLRKQSQTRLSRQLQDGHLIGVPGPLDAKGRQTLTRYFLTEESAQRLRDANERAAVRNPNKRPTLTSESVKRMRALIDGAGAAGYTIKSLAADLGISNDHAQLCATALRKAGLAVRVTACMPAVWVGAEFVEEAIKRGRAVSAQRARETRLQAGQSVKKAAEPVASDDADSDDAELIPIRRRLVSARGCLPVRTTAARSVFDLAGVGRDADTGRAWGQAA